MSSLEQCKCLELYNVSAWICKEEKKYDWKKPITNNNKIN